jgi:hypothetical protein
LSQGCSRKNSKTDYESNEIRITYLMGDMGLRKGVMRFLDSWNEMYKEYPNVNITLIGRIREEIRVAFESKILKDGHVKIIDWLEPIIALAFLICFVISCGYIIAICFPYIG